MWCSWRCFHLPLAGGLILCCVRSSFMDTVGRLASSGLDVLALGSSILIRSLLRGLVRLLQVVFCGVTVLVVVSIVSLLLFVWESLFFVYCPSRNQAGVFATGEISRNIKFAAFWYVFLTKKKVDHESW